MAAWGAITLTRRLRHDERATFRADSLVGCSARVITAIPADGFGEVHVTSSGHIRKVNARASHPIEAGSDVWVVAVVSPTAVEVRLSRDVPELPL